MKEGVKTGEGRKKPKIKAPERVNFIILDGISNSRSGVKNAKTLAMGIVKSGGPMDAFIILKASPRSGIEHVIGPEKNKTKLIRALENTYQDPRWILLVPARSMGRFSETDNAGREFNYLLWKMSSNETKNLHIQYRNELRRYSRSLRDLKFALKTIPFPKTIFLVSGGIQQITGDFRYYDQSYLNIDTYYEAMKKAAINIDKGGSWSRMVGKVQPIICQKLGETPKKKIILKKINVNIVKELQNRKLDIFVLNINPNTLKAGIDLFQRKVGEKETIDVEAQTGKKHTL